MDIRKDKLRITLHVYDEEMVVTIPRQEEEYYRSAAKLITERYNTYATLHKGQKSDHTIALMALVDITLRLEKEKEKNDTSPYLDVLKSLTADIEDALGQSE